MQNMVLSIAALMAMAGNTVCAATISEVVHGVIGGTHTKDVKGYFGRAGADLAGKPFTIALSYASRDFNQSGECRNKSCDYYSASATPAVPDAVGVSVTIAGAVQAYRPTTIAALFLSITGAPFFAIDADAYSGFGGYGPRGVQVYFQVMSNPKFGASLSPRNPVLNHKTSIDEVLFFDKSSQTPVEQLDLNVRRSAP